MSKFIHIIGIRNVNDGLTSKKIDAWLNADYIRCFTFFRLTTTGRYNIETEVPAVEITLSDASKVVSDDIKYFRSLIADTKSDSSENSEKG